MAAETSSQNSTVPDCEIVNETRCRGNVDLPEDLVINILLRLPVKSLIRFKIVCKPWNLLINSSVFVEKHLSSFSKTALLIIRDDDSFRKDYNLPFEVNYSVGSCNGIICFHVHGPNPLVIFNPSTREFSVLPKECKGHHYGFFYLSQTQEYKVLCFTMRAGYPNSFVDIIILTLGMKTKSVREVKDITLPVYLERDVSSNPAIFETCMLWSGYDSHVCKRIGVCYDVVEERFSKMDLPPFPTEKLLFSVKLLNNLVIMCMHSFEGATYFEIWTLINDGDSNDKSWIKSRTIGPSKAPTIYPVHVSSDLKLIICKKKDDCFAYRKYDRAYKIDELLYYDVESNQITAYEVPYPQVGIREFARYVETLVSPKSIY